mgnify:CR=1 FL=1
MKNKSLFVLVFFILSFNGFSQDCSTQKAISDDVICLGQTASIILSSSELGVTYILREGITNVPGQTFIGTGTDLTIKELAELIQKTVGHQGEIIWDSSKPDGTPRKLMDVSKMKNKGWSATISLEAGIKATYQWFLENENSFKEAVFTAVQSLPENWQAIDVLVNNAGLALGRDNFDEADMSDWETMIDTNIKGLLYVSRAVLPYMTMMM